MNAKQLEKLRLSAVKDSKQKADSFLSEQGLTGSLFLNHIVFFSDGNVTYHFSPIEPLEITSSVVIL